MSAKGAAVGRALCHQGHLHGRKGGIYVPNLLPSGGLPKFVERRSKFTQLVICEGEAMAGSRMKVASVAVAAAFCLVGSSSGVFAQTVSRQATDFASLFSTDTSSSFTSLSTTGFQASDLLSTSSLLTFTSFNVRTSQGFDTLSNTSSTSLAGTSLDSFSSFGSLTGLSLTTFTATTRGGTSISSLFAQTVETQFGVVTRAGFTVPSFN